MREVPGIKSFMYNRLEIIQNGYSQAGSPQSELFRDIMEVDYYYLPNSFHAISPFELCRQRALWASVVQKSVAISSWQFQ
jgi:hypothetical protein